MRVTVPVPIRWGDLDAYGHVNNAAMLVLLEEARVAVFWHGRHLPTEVAVGPDAPMQHATFVAHQEIEYLAPVTYSREPLPVQLWISRIGGASAEVNYEVVGPDGATAVRARTTIVMVDPATGRPRRLTAAERGLLVELTDEPLVFRRGR